VILLYQVVQVLNGAQLAAPRQSAFLLQFGYCLRVSRILIDVDHTRKDSVPGMESFAEEAFGSLGVPGGTEHKLHCTAIGVHGPVQIHPCTLDLDVGLIYPPGVVRGPELSPASFLQNGSITLDPAIDGRMINAEAPFSHHLFKISIT